MTQRELFAEGRASYIVRTGSEGPPVIVGSKAAAGVAERIVSLMPAHTLYLEIFAGRAAVGRRMRASMRSVLIERDPMRIAYLRRALPAATVILGDCRKILDPARVPADALVYADPPYPYDVRAGGERRYYDFEMFLPSDHERLIAWLKSFPCAVMLSGYRCELYDQSLKSWYREDIPTMTRGGPAIESVWCNFNPAMRERHDTRFFGQNFRERERIKRKAERWIKRFEQLPAGERAAILDRLSAAGLIPARGVLDNAGENGE